MTTKERLRSILTDVVGTSISDEELAGRGLNETLRFDELGLESLDIVELFTRVEEELGIFIPEEAFGGLESLADLERYVADRRAGAGTFDDITPAGAAGQARGG